MEIMWTSPTAEVLSIRNTKRADFVEITVDYWKNTHGARGREPYRTLPGDVLLLAERKPKTLYELKRMSTWCLSIVKETLPKDGATCKFLAHSLQHPRVDEGAFVIYLMNISTEKRIWKSLKKNTNMNIVEEVLYSDDNMEKKDDCEMCNFEAIDEQGFDHLNKSQQGAIKTSLSKTNCTHKSSVELIWGPPGTGKTKTVAVLLFSLLKLKCRTLICAPTNHAIRQVATCVLNLVKSSPDVSVEDVILFGNRERLGISGDVEEIFLENKVEALKNLEAFDFQEENTIRKVCLESAYLVMCTTSHSYNLHNLQNEPFRFLVIDEAAQLKEAESTIPLQLPGIMHVVLVGDECQLSAMVTSDMSAKWEFGRSLFGRLSLLGHPKKLLNIQYRMHPSISLFPNREFYYNQIMDAEYVKSESYGRSYLEGEMFGSYSFINVADGREEKDDDGQSRTNMVEVAVVVTIVKMLHQEWEKSKNKLTIGVVSPYVAQVLQIQEKIARYEDRDGFLIKVKTIDGFQGGEADIIILSTVQSNKHEFVGFLSSRQRINTALTRARHCLWIVGDGRTLETDESVWKGLIDDARKRGCFFDVATHKNLRKAIISVKEELKQHEDLVSPNSVLFKDKKWKVVFSEDFRRSFRSLNSDGSKKMVLLLLSKLAGGWRPEKIAGVTSSFKNSSQVLNRFKVKSHYVICTIDIIKDESYIQVLKIWDLLPLEEIQRLENRLEKVFAAYTEDFITLCRTTIFEGKLQIPMSWPASQEIIRFCDLSGGGEGEGEGGEDEGDQGEDKSITYVENTKVSESLLIMKFYPMSVGVANHLLSDEELDLPIQLTDEQRDISLFTRTSFIIGRSGTGKTTVLTSKLLRREEIFRSASGINDYEDGNETVLRQLFVTVSPRLCKDVKQYISHAARISFNENENPLVDDAGVLETFINIPNKKYPLIITFEKFLMMLDATLGTSFFKRFGYEKDQEVTFDRFCSDYWLHFDSNLKKKLDPSMVFTEIISHLKGGMGSDGKVSLAEYKSLAKNRTSTFTEDQREKIYKLFEKYEDRKTRQREFDLGDLVMDLHGRFKNEIYEVDQMDYVYIDEVQDLSMSQISLFKYICRRNAKEGFTFAGDTAQTIAKGVDFRFEDIKALFFTEFLGITGEQEKGVVSDIFQLKFNMRTHVGVLNLAQSVIDILCHYFPNTIDVLDPETSLVFGETPVVLETENDDESAIVKLFGGGERSGQTFEFGAEQVILVRNDSVRKEIPEIVRKKALILTIVECKGLEFRDVLLYKFFGTSGLNEKKWRIVQSLMKENRLGDEEVSGRLKKEANPSNVLCTELKHLYVAITRTRQRLWICEERADLSKSKPMFDYWNEKGLIQKQLLDESMARAMQANSSSQEWLARGKELFDTENYVMATLCFERAKNEEWEIRARAYGLRAAAHKMKRANPKGFEDNLKAAVKMFESIGEAGSVNLCNSALEHYERDGSGNIDTKAENILTEFEEAVTKTPQEGESILQSAANSVKMSGEADSVDSCNSALERDGSGSIDTTRAEGSSNDDCTINWNILAEFEEAVTKTPQEGESILQSAIKSLREEVNKMYNILQFNIEENDVEDMYKDELLSAEDLMFKLNFRLSLPASCIGDSDYDPQSIVDHLREVRLFGEAYLKDGGRQAS